MQLMSKELRNILWLGLLLGGLILAILAGWHQARTTSTAAASAEVEQGRQVYADQCASCHGADLEGQPDWRSPLPSGRLPAPPHDPSGHTWHHSDNVLFRIVKVGTAAVVGARFVNGASKTTSTAASPLPIPGGQTVSICPQH